MTYDSNLIDEYENIKEVGFEGTIEDFITYKESYGINHSQVIKDIIVQCPLCKSTNAKKYEEHDNAGQTIIVYYVCQEDGIMFKDIK